MSDKIAKVETLRWCVQNLYGYLQPRELGLLKEIFLAVSNDNHVDWGMQNQRRQGEVQALFMKCQRLINAHQA